MRVEEPSNCLGGPPGRIPKLRQAREAGEEKALAEETERKAAEEKLAAVAAATVEARATSATRRSSAFRAAPTSGSDERTTCGFSFMIVSPLVRPASTTHPASKCGPFAEPRSQGLADSVSPPLCLARTGIYRHHVAGCPHRWATRVSFATAREVAEGQAQAAAQEGAQRQTAVDARLKWKWCVKQLKVS